MKTIPLDAVLSVLDKSITKVEEAENTFEREVFRINAEFNNLNSSKIMGLVSEDSLSDESITRLLVAMKINNPAKTDEQKEALRLLVAVKIYEASLSAAKSAISPDEKNRLHGIQQNFSNYCLSYQSQRVDKLISKAYEKSFVTPEVTAAQNIEKNKKRKIWRGIGIGLGLLAVGALITAAIVLTGGIAAAPIAAGLGGLLGAGGFGLATGIITAVAGVAAAIAIGVGAVRRHNALEREKSQLRSQQIESERIEPTAVLSTPTSTAQVFRRTEADNSKPVSSVSARVEEEKVSDEEKAPLVAAPPIMDSNKPLLLDPALLGEESSESESENDNKMRK